MDKEQAVRLGTLIRSRRQAMGMSTYELGDRIGTRNSTIIRLEQGAFAAPSPEKLAGIAEALRISLADMYGHAGYVVPDDLPGFHAYLPARYRDLPAEAVQELVDLFDTLVARHGLIPQTVTVTAEGDAALEATP
jgi:transcriptional regulator with XRE-family HTH domain